MTTKILYYTLVLPFSLLPYPFLNLVSKGLYLIVYKIMGYRKVIAISNLRKAFPNKKQKEIENILSDFYLHLCYLIVEIVKMITASKSFINHRVSFSNIELLNNYNDKKQTIILVAGHFNNWEWVGQKISISAKQKWVSIYKPMSNKVINIFLKKARSKFGAVNISMNESMRYILKTKDTTQIIGIIADQNPVVNKTTEWVKFFGREVPIFMGAEKIARKMNYPVVFCDVQKIGIGKYNINFEELEAKPKSTAVGKITKRYINRLERQIENNPSKWLWTHRRWKHKR